VDMAPAAHKYRLVLCHKDGCIVSGDFIAAKARTALITVNIPILTLRTIMPSSREVIVMNTAHGRFVTSTCSKQQ